MRFESLCGLGSKYLTVEYEVDQLGNIVVNHALVSYITGEEDILPYLTFEQKYIFALQAQEDYRERSIDRVEREIKGFPQ